MSEPIEDNPHFACRLTPGEIAMFAKIEREQAVHNALGAALGAYKDRIVEQRNMFVRELCRKYGITNPSRVTYDQRTQRFVSIFSAELIAVKIDGRPRAIEQCSRDMTAQAIRELLAIYQEAQAGGQPTGT